MLILFRLGAKFVAIYAFFLGVKFGWEDLLRLKDLTFRNSVCQKNPDSNATLLQGFLGLCGNLYFLLILFQFLQLNSMLALSVLWHINEEAESQRKFPF